MNQPNFVVKTKCCLATLKGQATIKAKPLAHTKLYKLHLAAIPHTIIHRIRSYGMPCAISSISGKDSKKCDPLLQSNTKASRSLLGGAT